MRYWGYSLLQWKRSTPQVRWSSWRRVSPASPWVEAAGRKAVAAELVEPLDAGGGCRSVARRCRPTRLRLPARADLSAQIRAWSLPSSPRLCRRKTPAPESDRRWIMIQLVNWNHISKLYLEYISLEREIFILFHYSHLHLISITFVYKL